MIVNTINIFSRDDNKIRVAKIIQLDSGSYTVDIRKQDSTSGITIFFDTEQELVNFKNSLAFAFETHFRGRD